MSVNLKIKVTKEILWRSRMCGENDHLMNSNCAIALSVRDVFPKALVEDKIIIPFPTKEVHYYLYKENDLSEVIELPKEATEFINAFDVASPDGRMAMPELEFEVEISDGVIDRINIDSLRPLLANHPTLQLI